MKLGNFLKSETREFFRDFSAFGNILILILIFLLVFEGKFLIKAVFGLFITYGICYALKFFMHTNRPERIKYSNTLERLVSGSFPSVHSAVIMYAGLLIISRTDKLLVGISFLILVLVVAYSRHYLGKHYLKDILGGFAIGVLVFLFI